MSLNPSLPSPVSIFQWFIHKPSQIQCRYLHVICSQLCAQNSYHMTEGYTAKVPLCYVINVHHGSGSQTILGNRSASFLQPEQFTSPLPPLYNDKINKNTVKLQKRLFEVCRLFSELQKICYLFQIASLSNQEMSLNTLHALIRSFMMSTLFFLTQQVSTTMS